MNFDEIRKNLDKIIAERMRIHEDDLFGRIYRFSGFRDAQGRMAIPDDGKTITLSKDDYRVVEEEEG